MLGSCVSSSCSAPAGYGCGVCPLSTVSCQQSWKRTLAKFEVSQLWRRPLRAFSQLKAPSWAFKCKTLLRHHSTTQFETCELVKLREGLFPALVVGHLHCCWTSPLCFYPQGIISEDKHCRGGVHSGGGVSVNREPRKVNQVK